MATVDAAPATPSRSSAARILDDGFGFLLSSLAPLPEASLTERGTIGGGDWSAKDLLGHITFWERNGVQALEAWARGGIAPVDRMLEAPGLDAANAAAVEAAFAFDLSQTRANAEQTHRALVDAINLLTDTAWELPALAGEEGSLGFRLGTILVGGDADLFDHVSAHNADLEAFVAAAASRT